MLVVLDSTLKLCFYKQMNPDDLLSEGWDSGFTKPRLTAFSTTKDTSFEQERESGFDSEDESEEGEVNKDQDDNSQFYLDEQKIEIENAFSTKQLKSVRGNLYLATDDNSIYYYEEEGYREYDVDQKADERIHKIFVDPVRGDHVIVSMTNGENYYFNASVKPPKPPKLLAKLKGPNQGIVIESIGWDLNHITKDFTGALLIGTTDSCICELRIDNTFKDLVKHFKILYDFKDKSDVIYATGPITGLEVEAFPKSKTQSHAYFVMAVTQYRCFQFVGGPDYEALFDAYKKKDIIIQKELPYSTKRSSVSSSELCFIRIGKRSADTFVWLSTAGIFHGTISYHDRETGADLIHESEIIQYDKALTPISIAVTEFHMVLLFQDKIQIIMQPPGLCNSTSSNTSNANEISQVPISTIKIVFEEYLSGKGTPLGVCQDPITGELFAYTDDLIYKLVITDEERDVWRLYIEKALEAGNSNSEYFDIARRLVEDDPKKSDIVLIAKADHLFKIGAYEEAAAIYAGTSKCFEEIAIAFHNKGQKDALRKFLLKKLKLTLLNQKDESKKHTQPTCLCTWLTELYLDKLNQLRDDGEQHAEEYRKMQAEFWKFLEVNQDHLDHNTTFRLISSHGRIEEVTQFATFIKEYDRVISHHISEGDYAKALEILDNQCKEDSQEKQNKYSEHFYKFAPVLMQHLPKETVDVLKRKTFLNPGKLIPALMRYIAIYNPESREENHVIKYLEAVVQTNEDPAIHNLLLSLYAKQKDSTNLLEFLRTERDNNYYDIKYALRICMENKQTEACVRLYSAMGLYEDAVELALSKDDISLARDCADKPDDDELMKKLWLKIAKHVIEKEENVKKAIEFLSETDKIKLEDILPFFPDTVLIDDFKNEICKSLEEYKREIEELKHDMVEATTNATLIRDDIKELKHRYGYITANAKCNAPGCFHNILSRDFYLFPCQHMFHADCLIEEVKKHITSAQRLRIDKLVKKKRMYLEKMASQNTATSGGDYDSQNQNIESEEQKELRELDELISAECPFCGDMMINTIDTPFVENDDVEFSSWRIGSTLNEE